jgi:hypothetical protein
LSLPREQIEALDDVEWQALEDAHAIKQAREKLERVSLAGAKQATGRPFELYHFLPPHLARKYAPPPPDSDERFAAFARLFGSTPVSK